MPKPTMTAEDATLESEIIETMLAGLKEWRPDLDYPESYSDMQGCVRALIRMFEMKRRPLAAPLKLRCGGCDGIGQQIKPGSNESFRESFTCPVCKGRRYIEN